MGYWNGWGSYQEWYEVNVGTPKICIHCGGEFYPTSGRQKMCNREQSPFCDDDRYFQKLWDKGTHPLQKLGLNS